MIALIIIGFVVWSNFRQMQADAAATAATGMMRLGMVPEPVRAECRSGTRRLRKSRRCRWICLQTLLRSSARGWSKGPCSDWRDCINGFPEGRYGGN
jgi:hypothetical protein